MPDLWRDAWFSQAHYIFTCHGITSHLQDYGMFCIHTLGSYVVNIFFLSVLADSVVFILSISGPNTTPPPGYLFVCPMETFKTGSSTAQWPDSPTYWSLDPTGVERLSTEEAMRLGFPSMEFRTDVFERSWNASVYAGLRQFYEAKGFDPASQDLARHMGCSLFRVSGAMNTPFAHSEFIIPW
ncbi:hypothetical protein C8R46DRAFT_913068 [Mycena filopes]|nr:hypothetical protein C8R46DRAFT_913068 [Mycena filopes]